MLTMVCTPYISEGTVYLLYINGRWPGLMGIKEEMATYTKRSFFSLLSLNQDCIVVPSCAFSCHTHQDAQTLMEWMSVCLVTIVSWVVTLCPNLEFHHFRESCSSIKDNPKECSFRSNASFFLIMTWKWLNLSYLFSDVRGSLETSLGALG